jgi:hypothetical protein
LYFALDIFGRGFGVMFNTFDPAQSRKIVAAVLRMRHGVVTRRITLASCSDGGLEFTVQRGHRTQGWRLRGPVEHFEYN